MDVDQSKQFTKRSMSFMTSYSPIDKLMITAQYGHLLRRLSTIANPRGR